MLGILMGLMKLSGDLYDFYEDTKTSQVDPTLANSITPSPEGVKDELPAPVGAPLGKLDPPPAPKSNEPPQLFTPGMPNGNNLQSTLPPMVRNIKVSSDFSLEDFPELMDTQSPAMPVYSQSRGSNSNFQNFRPYDAVADTFAARRIDRSGVGTNVDTTSSPFGSDNISYEDMNVAGPTSGTESQVPSKVESEYSATHREISEYLIGMGYTPEEAAKVAPTLLSKVNLEDPNREKTAMINDERSTILTHLLAEGYLEKEASLIADQYLAEAYGEPEPMQKTASVYMKQVTTTFNKHANSMVAEYVEAGYSPYQAKEMAATVIIPMAEKVASLRGRIAGGAIGSLGGGLGGSFYDDEGEVGGKATGAVLGGILGAAAGGRIPQYFRRNYSRTDGGAGQKLIDDAIEAARADVRQGAVDLTSVTRFNQNMQRAGLGGIQRPVDPVRQRLVDASRELQRQQNPATDDFAQLVTDHTRGLMASDAKKLLAATGVAAVPAYALHKGLAGDGKDNVADSTIDSLYDAAEMVADNPEYLAAAGAGAAGLYGLHRLSEAVQDRLAKPKKGRSKTASRLTDAVKQYAKTLPPGSAYGNIVGGAGIGAGTGLWREINKDDPEDINLARAAVSGGGIGALAGVLGRRISTPKFLALGATVPAGYSVKRVLAPMDRRDYYDQSHRGVGGEGRTGHLLNLYKDESGKRPKEERGFFDSFYSGESDDPNKRSVDYWRTLDNNEEDDTKSLDSVLDAPAKVMTEAASASGNWIAENPLQAAALGLGTAGALYGGHRLLNDIDDEDDFEV